MDLERCPVRDRNPDLDVHFASFRKDIIGIDQTIETCNGNLPLVYMDWTASGRAYRPVENRMAELRKHYGNSHSEDSYVGRTMTRAYEYAHDVIARHVNASPSDVVFIHGTGVTGCVNWFQRMLEIRESARGAGDAVPVVIVTRMEHHSNHTSWLATGAQVELLDQTREGLPNIDHLETLCQRFRDQGRAIYGSFSACSNVTGIVTPYSEMARVMHAYGGKCFVDFAASAPYVRIDMHPADPLQSLDAVYFSPHKFLGGPGAAGVMVFDSGLYRCEMPVSVGGGIVSWTNPWGEFRIVDDIREREGAGTPGILQAAQAALATRTKDKLNVYYMSAREGELLQAAVVALANIHGVRILGGVEAKRIGIISFSFEELHYGLATKLLSDRYGIQARGGCSCAGTYGHELFGIDREHSKSITEMIDRGDFSTKPGWVRISLHPTLTNQELEYVLNAINEIALLERMDC